MSLARNPEMTWQAAGRQLDTNGRMRVYSHVHVPAADAREDYDGRVSYAAPCEVRRREAVTVSMKTVLIFSAIAVAVLFVFYGKVSAKRKAVIREGKEIVAQIDAARSQIAGMNAQITAAQDESTIGYQAVHRFDMVSSKGQQVEEIYAPDTRPNLNMTLLAGAGLRAALEE